MSNFVKIDGDENIIIQDIENSTIKIHASDTKKLQAFLSNALDEIKHELFKVLLDQRSLVFNSAQNIVAQSINTLPKTLTCQTPSLAQSKIIGRSKDLVNLHEMLFKNRQIVVVNGLGGIGKTTLAQVYVNKYWDEYHHISWITQLSEDITFDFANAKCLRKNLGVTEGTKESNEVFSKICQKLNSIENQPNLLVIDDADSSIEKLIHYLPKQPSWHILITSRQELHGFSIKQLDFLNEKDAIKLFKSNYKRKDLTEEQIKELIEDVDYHTLTIEILAKTAMRQRYSFSKLKTAITDNARANIDVDRLGTDRIDRISSFLCSIFDSTHLSEDELWLLKQLTCLPPDFQPFELLKELINPEKSNKEEIFSETFEFLCEKGWLIKREETDSFKIHRVLAEVVKKQAPITLDEIKPLAKSITTKLSFDKTIDNPANKIKWINYGEALVSILQNPASDTKEYKIALAFLQNNLAIPVLFLGNHSRAKELLLKAIDVNKEYFGEEHINTIINYANLALVYNESGNHEEAKKLSLESLKSIKSIEGENHPNTAVTYSNLAAVIQNFGNYTEAIKLTEKALALDILNYGEEHPVTMIRYSNLASINYKYGNKDRAIKLFAKVIDFNEKHFGIEHLNTAISYLNKAVVLVSVKKMEDAAVITKKALNIFKEQLPPNHTYIKDAEKIIKLTHLKSNS